MQSTEKWLPVVGYEGRYEVSDHGQVRSVSRTVIRSNGAPQTVAGRLLKDHDFRGYRQVNVRNSDGQRLLFVHQLVATAFIRPGVAGEEVCHGDGQRSNNHVSNLRWGTRSDNVQDMLRHGTHANASKTRCKRGHEFTTDNTRTYARADGSLMRICVACRQRKVECEVCGTELLYYALKPHLYRMH